jgi:hypothetical protein
LDQRARLSVVLIAVAIGMGAYVAVASSPRVAAPAARPAPASLSDIASADELKLWTNRGCVTCHGPDARGGPMAPDLTKVLPLYLAKFGSAGAAKERIVAYLLDPQGSPKLRDDGVQFPNPMPSIEKLFGGTRTDAETLAGLLVRLVR